MQYMICKYVIIYVNVPVSLKKRAPSRTKWWFDFGLHNIYRYYVRDWQHKSINTNCEEF